MLVLKVLDLGSQALGPGDGVTAIFDETGNFLKLLGEITVSDYVFLLESDATKVGSVGEYWQLMNQGEFFGGLIDDVADLFGHFDEFFHFSFE